MNEIRDLIIGIDFGKDYSQICYYDRERGGALLCVHEGWCSGV